MKRKIWTYEHIESIFLRDHSNLSTIIDVQPWWLCRRVLLSHGCFTLFIGPSGPGPGWVWRLGPPTTIKSLIVSVLITLCRGVSITINCQQSLQIQPTNILHNIFKVQKNFWIYSVDIADRENWSPLCFISTLEILCFLTILGDWWNLSVLASSSGKYQRFPTELSGFPVYWPRRF